MQTKLLTILLENIIEINRSAEYKAGFRYTVDHTNMESLAVDLYRGNQNFLHRVIYSNDDLKKAILDITTTVEDKTVWMVSYRDDLLSIEETVPSEILATSKAFMLKERYNISAIITEIKNEDLQ